MNNTGKLAGLTVFVTGATRGIGKSIALKFARDGANVAIASKTAQPHSKLEGTLFTVAEEIEKVGGKALPCVVDVRKDNEVEKAIEDTVRKFGGIDIVVNNASAIWLGPVSDTDMKKYDLMQQVNARGTFLVSKLSLPYLKKSKHAHILNIATPPLMQEELFFENLAYKISKYGMSMCTLGMAEEFKPYNISVNALWPRSVIWTAATVNRCKIEETRSPDIMGDAAYAIVSQDPKDGMTGQFLFDEHILRKFGVTDFKQYAMRPEQHDRVIILSRYADAKL